MSFLVEPIAASAFAHLYGLSDNELSAKGAHAYIAKNMPGFPCRVELRDAEIGERLILLNYCHQDTLSPFRSSHAIFVIDGAKTAKLVIDEIPKLLEIRQLSIRAFKANGFMTDAEVVMGTDLESTITRLFSKAENSYLHVHNAARGCYLAKIIRAGI